MSDNQRPNFLYRIYYGDMLMYVGRTHQSIRARLRGHFFGAPMHRKLDLFLTTKVEYAECETEADMYLYEIYYINKPEFKPPCNIDDRAVDTLTVELPELEWHVFEEALDGSWATEIAIRDEKFKEKAEAARMAFEKMSVAGDMARENRRPDGTIDWTEYRKAKEEWEIATKEAKVW